MSAILLGLGWVTPGGMGAARNAGGFALGGGELPELERRDVFNDAYQRFGRLDRFSRLGLAAITFALRDARLEEWQEKRSVGIIASTRLGCLVTDIDYFDGVIPEQGKLASPNLFAYTLPNCFLGEAAIRFGLTGSNFIVSGRAGDPLLSLRLGLESLAWGEEEVVVVGCCDLEAPPGLTDFAGEDPGAVFAVLVRSSDDGYGQLTVDAAGAVLFNGVTVEGWSELVWTALSSCD